MSENDEILGKFEEESTGLEMRMRGRMEFPDPDVPVNGVPIFGTIEVARDGEWITLQEFLDEQ